MLNKKTYLQISGILFLFIAIGHLLRIINSWEVVFNGSSMSFWPSWIVVVVTGFLAYNSFKLAKE